MWLSILGTNWTLRGELITSQDLVRRLAADVAGRLTACAVVAALVAYSASLNLAVLWVVLVSLNELTEIKLANRLRDTRLSDRARLVPYMLHLGVGAVLWTGMCLTLWLQGDFIDKLTAGATLIGILIHGSLFYNESRLQSLVTGLPPLAGAAIMIVSAIADPVLTHREKAVAGVALFSLCTYLSTGVYKSVRTRETVRELIATTARLAAEDPLTGLHNRRSFFEKVEAHSAPGSDFIIAFVDLDRFKPLNDEFGHAVGDEVLKVIARRLEQHPGIIAAARLGGDEFAILCACPADEAAAAWRMGEIYDSVVAPINSAAGVVSVGASIGWARTSDGGAAVTGLLNSADVAMRRAKIERLGLVKFDPVTDSAALTSSAIEIAFRQALAKEQIKAALQPIISAKSGKIVSMELLARWPDSGFARDPAPQEFIPIAERLGLLNEMMWSTLRQALPMLAGTTWSLAINVSPSQLTSHYFLQKLMGMIRQYGVPPTRIELEITEQVAFRNVVENCAVLNEARALGFRVVLDDFGAGYSSLAMLDRLPLDKIKLDREFVGELMTRTEIQKILKATVSLAHELGMICSVEGIECPETAAMVTGFGCDQIQGYWVGKPEVICQPPVLLGIAS